MASIFAKGEKAAPRAPGYIGGPYMLSGECTCVGGTTDAMPFGHHFFSRQSHVAQSLGISRHRIGSAPGLPPSSTLTTPFPSSFQKGTALSAILFVCEGNVCRSALAERILRKCLNDVWGDALAISSAGTDARVGEPMDEQTAAVADALGVDSTNHFARMLTAEQLRDATLVLTGTREQRSAVVRVWPASVKYTLTIRQFGRILQDSVDDPEFRYIEQRPFPERIPTLLSFVVKRRGQRPRPDPLVDDVVDPSGQPRNVHELAARQMVPALNHLAVSLGGVRIDQKLNSH